MPRGQLGKGSTKQRKLTPHCLCRLTAGGRKGTKFPFGVASCPSSVPWALRYFTICLPPWGHCLQSLSENCLRQPLRWPLCHTSCPSNSTSEVMPAKIPEEWLAQPAHPKATWGNLPSRYSSGVVALSEEPVLGGLRRGNKAAGSIVISQAPRGGRVSNTSLFRPGKEFTCPPCTSERAQPSCKVGALEAG